MWDKLQHQRKQHPIGYWGRVDAVKRERETDRQTDRQTDRVRVRDRQRQKEREREYLITLECRRTAKIVIKVLLLVSIPSTNKHLSAT